MKPPIFCPVDYDKIIGSAGRAAFDVLLASIWSW